ncbi:MAG: hypothetical protein LBN28_03240, partial [Desulfovibrio sp.]|nr:hypothetical protein [Desulfovibrio sp.]
MLFKSKRILSCGFNSVRNFSAVPNKWKKFPESLHSEMMAIMLIKNKELLQNANMLIVRLNRSNNLRLAKPCDNCMRSIMKFKIKNIFYSLTNDD